MRHVYLSHFPGMRRRSAGVTLVELMVALAIGSFLMIGAITVFMQSRMTFRVTESVARLQENGRFALDTLEPDIRMASYWGLTSRGGKIDGRGGPTDPQGPGPTTCGTNWTNDLENALQGTNNGYSWACTGTAPVATADTLVIRRASENAIPAPAAGALYVQSARFQNGQIFVGPAIPAGYTAATSETHQLIVHGYYIGGSTLFGNAVPALRRKTLVGGAIQDQEILPGVEDMQIEFGVDTDVIGAANRGSIDRYVNPGDPIITPGNAAFLEDAEILGVRIWLRLRAERPETGFTDTATYVYADRNVPAFNDGFRRIVVSKTVYLRNARPPS